MRNQNIWRHLTYLALILENICYYICIYTNNRGKPRGGNARKSSLNRKVTTLSYQPSPYLSLHPSVDSCQAGDLIPSPRWGTPQRWPQEDLLLHRVSKTAAPHPMWAVGQPLQPSLPTRRVFVTSKDGSLGQAAGIVVALGLAGTLNWFQALRYHIPKLYTSLLQCSW